MPVFDVTFKYPSPLPNLFGKRVRLDAHQCYVEAKSPDEIINIFEEFTKKMKVDGLLSLTNIRAFKQKSDFEELLTLDGLKDNILEIVKSAKIGS